MILLDASFHDFNEIRPAEPPPESCNTIGRKQTVGQRFPRSSGTAGFTSERAKGGIDIAPIPPPFQAASINAWADAVISLPIRFRTRAT